MSSYIKVLQININRSSPTTENVLQTAIELDIKVLVIQEPWVIAGNNNREYRSIIHPSYFQILPNYGALRPRTLIYIARELQASLAQNSPSDPDCLIIDLSLGILKMQLINFYNTIHPEDPNSILTILKEDILPTTLYNSSLLLGDFNIYYPWWDPLKPQSSYIVHLISYIENYSLRLLNKIGEGTFYRSNISIPSVLDLSFATSGIVTKIKDWQVLPDLGSDHFGVLFTISKSTYSSSSNPVRFNTKKADWAKFTSYLTNSLENMPFLLNSTNQELDLLAEDFTNRIVEAASNSIPKSTTSPYSKPWWNEDLKTLRKSMLYYSRKCKASGYTLYKQELQNAKNTYFNAIKSTKLAHWNKFLENEDSQSIFKAMKYTKDTIYQPIPSILSSNNELKSTFQEKCNIFRTVLFPPPPITESTSLINYRPSSKWDWPILSKIELEQACTSKIKGKTPGPDLVTQEIIVHAYRASPDIFYRLYSLFINKGYHPKVWKQATGFILKKSGKPNYSLPKAYRVISLLNCLGKVSERILARRLSYLAETSNLLYYSQMGGRLYKSAINTALLLQNEVEANKSYKLKTSTLFLDVKGAFDHVSKNRLLQIMISLLLPTSLILWVSSFLDDRVLRLAFDNSIEAFRSILTGIPQGSPISPILFLIYIRDLFKSANIKFRSYLDDISLTTASKSLKKNIKTLEREVKDIVDLGKKNTISFNIDKTELIHFDNSKNKPSLKLPNRELVSPSRVVKWLGIYFDENLRFKEHIAYRASKAKQAFYRVQRLTNISYGLSPFAIRQLYLACITSIIDYGSIL